MTNRLALKLGFWSALVVAVLSVVYLGVLVVNFATAGFTFPPPKAIQLMGGIITFLSAPAILVLFAAIKSSTSQDKGILGTLGLSFTTLFALSVSINRFVQLSIIQQSPPTALSRDLARFLPYDTGSVMFALEILGWGFFLSLAALSVAPLFEGNRIKESIRWLLLAYALFSLLSVLGFLSASPLTAAGFVAWGPILVATSTLLSIHFYQAEKTAN